MSEDGITRADFDGDGVNDTIMIDADGDGLAETTVSQDPSGGLDVLSDTDADGIYDTASLDSDGDGAADTIEYDTTGDGVIDFVDYDTDGDGLVDVTSGDADGDGVVDTTATDLDFDGVVDVVEYDTEGDGHTDLISVAGQTLFLDDSGHVVDLTSDPGDGDPSAEPATWPDSHTDPVSDYGHEDVNQFDPNTFTAPAGADETPAEVQDPFVADPEATERADDAQNWFEQSENGFCAPASVAQIVAEYSDQPILDDSVFVQRAVDLGYLSYDEAAGGGWSGITVEQSKDLLESFGVPATVQTGSVDILDQYLDRGYNAIVSIDSSEVWYGQATGNADHAVVVSSIENGMVYLNDPGSPDGQLEPVPVEVFEQAWSVSNDQMIVTDNPDTGSTGTPGVGVNVFVDPGTGLTSGASDTNGADTVTLPVGDANATTALSDVEGSGPSRGTVILPILLAGAAVRAWLHRK